MMRWTWAFGGYRWSAIVGIWNIPWKVHMSKAWSPAWCYWEVAGPLRSGAWWKLSHWECPLNGDIGTLGLLLPLCLSVTWNKQFAPPCASHLDVPSQQVQRQYSQPTMDWNPEIVRWNKYFLLFNLIFSGIFSLQWKTNTEMMWPGFSKGQTLMANKQKKTCPNTLRIRKVEN